MKEKQSLTMVKYPSHCEDHFWYQRGCKACQYAYRQYIIHKRLQEKRDKALREAKKRKINRHQSKLEKWLGIEIKCSFHLLKIA